MALAFVCDKSNICQHLDQHKDFIVEPKTFMYELINIDSSTTKTKNKQNNNQQVNHNQTNLFFFPQRKKQKMTNKKE